MRHLQHRLFVCKEDFNSFKKDQIYWSGSSSNQMLNLYVNNEHVAVDDVDLIGNFRLLDSDAVLKDLMTYIEIIKNNKRAIDITGKDVADELFNYLQELLPNNTTYPI